MNKELEFLEEKYGHNSWNNYPPSKQQVALWLKEYTEKQLSIHVVSESTYPKEFVHLAKGNYLDKDGSIKKAQTMIDHLGNEYFMVAKDKLYSR